MKKQIANYTVIIKKENRTGTKKACYSAYVPSLEVATEADTLEQVQKDIKSLVEFHLECLAKEGEEIPFESKHPLVTTFEAFLPKGIKLSY